MVYVITEINSTGISKTQGEKIVRRKFFFIVWIFRYTIRTRWYKNRLMGVFKQ